MTTTTDLSALVKQVVVAADVARAFELFTARMGDWWPVRTHSVGGDRATRVALAGQVGGEIVETIADGTTAVWGTVTEWSPPDRVAFTWHPGAPVEEATLVEVSFTPHDDGTLVALVHTGWAARPDGARARAGYSEGWELVLAPLADLAVAAGGSPSGVA
jgi:uncharacterized protein YndB with AHSA1/START domain